LANHFAAQGKDVHLVTFDFPEASSYYELAPEIHWHRLAQTPPHSPIGFWQRISLINRIRKVLKNIDRPIMICFHHGLLSRVFAASLGLRLPVICSERNSLEIYDHITQTRKWSLSFIMLALTSFITVQFPRYIRDYPWWLRTRMCVIPNPVFSKKKYAVPDRPSLEGRFTLLHVGRLCDQKNLVLLINSFACISDRNPLWDLKIVGDGELEGDILALITSLGLVNRVFLLGKRHDIPELLLASHLFCLPSKWEGFPNALAEAMAQGLPSVGLWNCSGVRDLIVNYETGRLTDELGLPKTLDELMHDPESRHSMGFNARAHISKYSPDEAFKCWDDLVSKFKSY